MYSRGTLGIAKGSRERAYKTSLRAEGAENGGGERVSDAGKGGRSGRMPPENSGEEERKGHVCPMWLIEKWGVR